MRNTSLQILCVALVIAVCQTADAAPLYRCVGKNGIPTFTDSPTHKRKCKCIQDCPTKRRKKAVWRCQRKTDGLVSFVDAPDKSRYGNCKKVPGTGSSNSAYTESDRPRRRRDKTHRTRRVDTSDDFITRKKSTRKATLPRSTRKEVRLSDLPHHGLVTDACEKYELPQALVHAVIEVESNYHVKAVSSAGAQGLMQLMPRTAESLGVDDPFDPRENIFGGTQYLRRLTNQFNGDIIKVIAAYHAGPGAVSRKGGIPYAATERYVKKVLGKYYDIQETQKPPGSGE